MTTDWYSYPNNYSNGSSVDGVGSFFQYIGFTTNNWLGYGMIFIIWLTVFGLSMVSGSKKAMLSASFISFIFSVYLVSLGMLSPLVSIVFIILTIVGMIGSSQEVSY